MLIAGAFGLWGLFPLATASAWVWAYLALWGVLAAVGGRGGGRTKFRWPTGLGLGVCLGLALPGVFSLGELGAQLVNNEQLPGLVGVLSDRDHNLRDPHLHPPVLQLDRPQVFWIRAEGASQVSLRIGEARPELAAQSVGADLFRVTYDPRRDARPSAQNRDLGAWVVVDGRPVPQRLHIVPLRARPGRLRRIPDDNRALAVSPETDELLLLGPPGVVQRWPVGDGPVAAVATSSQSVWVAHRHEPTAWELDAASGRVMRKLRLSAGLSDLVICEGQLAAVVTSPPGLWTWGPETAPQRVELPVAPDRLFCGGPGQLIVASRRARRLDRVQRRVGAWTPMGPPLVLGRPVRAAALDLDSGALHVAVSDHRPQDDAGPNHQVLEQWLTVDLGSWRVTRAQPTLDLVSQDGLHGAGTSALSHYDGQLVAAFEGSETLFSARTGLLPSPVFSPNSVVPLPDGDWLLTSGVEGAVVWFDPRTGQSRARADLDGPEPMKDSLRRGERNFLEATRSGTSCASCHPDEDSDHALHDIGHGQPRPTLSVRGLAGTSPFLRGASYPTLDSLNPFAESILGGYTRADASRAQDLQAYVLSLPPPAVPAHFATGTLEVLRRGMAAFTEAGCPGCHAGPAFTDLAQYPSALLFPERTDRVLLDTPSLIGVSATPPYLFDGRAEDLRAVFETHDPSRRHGRFSSLSPVMQADLLRMLEVL